MCQHEKKSRGVESSDHDCDNYSSESKPFFSITLIKHLSGYEVEYHSVKGNNVHSLIRGINLSDFPIESTTLLCFL